MSCLQGCSQINFKTQDSVLKRGQDSGLPMPVVSPRLLVMTWCPRSLAWSPGSSCAGPEAGLQLTAVWAGVISQLQSSADCRLSGLQPLSAAEAGLHRWLEAGVHKGTSIPLQFTTRPRYYYSRTNQTSSPASIFHVKRNYLTHMSLPQKPY